MSDWRLAEDREAAGDQCGVMTSMMHDEWRKCGKTLWLISVLLFSWTPALFAQPPIMQNGPEVLPGPIVPTRDDGPRDTIDERTLEAPSIFVGESNRIPLREQEPKTIFVQTDDGEFVPFYNITLARIQRLLDMEAGLAAQGPPPFHIDQLRIVGTADEKMATLDVSLDVVLLQDPNQSSSRWTLVPLRFHDASLLETPVYEGDGQLYLTFDPEEGYQGWLRHKQPGKHTIRLKFGVSLSQRTDALQMRFFPPLANRSQLDLQVSGKGVKADLENARNLSITEGADGKSRLIADDLRNQVVMTWREGGQLEAEPPTFLDVRGDIRVQVDGPADVRSYVALDVTRYGGLIEEFAVRLPPNTTIVSGDQPGYRIRERSANSQDERPLMQVKLDKPSAQARFQFTTQTTEASTGQSILNVGNFEVVGAIQQSGRVSLLTGEEWLVFWELGPYVTRVQNVDTTEATQRRLLASFEYFRQPCQLSVKVQPQGTFVDVQPTYRMRVDEDRVQLNADFSYNVRGAQVSFRKIALNDWILEDVGPPGAVENDDFDEDQVDEIQLRLTKASSGVFNLSLQLYRPLTSERGRLRLPLPVPEADRVSAGSVWVESADSVLLDYRLPEMPLLTQDRALAQRFLAETQETIDRDPSELGNAFRILTDSATPNNGLGEVVCDYEIRDQEVVVRVDSRLELAADRATVVQDFAYRVRYKPTSRIVLDLPRKLVDLLRIPRQRENVSLQIDGEELETAWYENAIDVTDDVGDSVQVPVGLGETRRGSFTARLSYTWRLPEAGAGVDSTVPLVVPRGGKVLSNVVILTPVSGLRVEPASDGNWMREDDLVAGNQLQSVGLKTPNRPSEVRLRVLPMREASTESTALSGTVVERAWYQTWLSRKQRMDRFVFRLSTAGESITVTLPPGVEQTRAYVDGSPINLLMTDREVQIPLIAGAEHTVELKMTYLERPKLGGMTFEVPQIVDANDRFRWFWQLLVPEDEHLLASDARLTSANRWVREGWFWRRSSDSVANQLEHWTNATSQPPLPDGLNRYLFSSFERVESFEVRTVSRRALVNISSLTFLSVGLAMLYLPVARHPVLLLLLSVGLFASVWVNTDAAVMVAQACLFGLALCLLSMVTLAVVRTLEYWRSDTVSIGSTVTRATSDSHSGQVRAWKELGPTHTTVSAPPAPVPPSASDSNM